MGAERNVWTPVILASIIVSMIHKYYQLISIVKEIIYAEQSIDIVCIFNRETAPSIYTIIRFGRKHQLARRTVFRYLILQSAAIFPDSNCSQPSPC